MIGTAKFGLGRTLATPAALPMKESAFFLDRHVVGDWGEVCQDDAQLNDEALKDGDRIISAYTTLKGVRLWIITEAADAQGQRPATTILLPDEY